MPICVAVPKEIASGENRVAMVPEVAKKLHSDGVQLVMQKDAGAKSYLPDSEFDDVDVLKTAKAVFNKGQVILKVQPPTEAEIKHIKEGAILICFMQAHQFPERVKQLQEKNITVLAMELVPRISRAQSIDALSSQASIAGYKGALMAASLAPQFFPMLTTAAGTVRPAKVLVLGAGVAGLQAIATARRLGAMVEAYDVRSATKEQVESLGAKFVDTGIQADAEGGYARELNDEEKQQQQQILADHIAAANAVITTAAIPGRPSPKLIAKEVVERMSPGAVIIDLAAEGGGNCELTEPGKLIEHQGVQIHGPLNVPSMLPVHASEMYTKNLYNLLKLMLVEGELKPDWEDEVLAGSTLTRDGEIKHESTRKLVEEL